MVVVAGDGAICARLTTCGAVGDEGHGVPHFLLLQGLVLVGVPLVGRLFRAFQAFRGQISGDEAQHNLGVLEELLLCTHKHVTHTRTTPNTHTSVNMPVRNDSWATGTHRLRVPEDTRDGRTVSHPSNLGATTQVPPVVYVGSGTNNKQLADTRHKGRTVPQ